MAYQRVLVDRRRVADDVRRSHHIAFRTTDALRDQLKAAAEAAGRPLTEEIERRLRQSFAKPSDPSRTTA